MAEVRSRRTAGSRRGRGRGQGQRRLPTWEVSDSDPEGANTAEAGAEAGGVAGERRAAVKARRPEQVLRRLVVCVDPAVLEDAGADILMEALGALGCECRIETQRLARSLQWNEVRPSLDPCGVPPELQAEDEQELLLLLEPQEFLQGAAQLTQMSSPPCSMPWIPLESLTHLHLAVIGLEAYLWSHQPSAQRIQQLESPEVSIGWPEVEEALVLLQLFADLDVLLVASWQELSQHVCAFTKALAQRPSKQCRDTQAFAFCTAGRWASGQRVSRDGSGLRGVWWKQIRQFNRVSPAVADAIVTAFPSPRLLQQAFSACSTEQERLGLLADLPVKAREGRQPRRVGPDLSRRICLFLTTANPDLLLDLGF
uniref:Structure-specific endonuclease subunit EME2 n=1 Tax=Castor canadensis TaxID=51338 RepID=A0A8C0XX39_CASCN